MNVKMRVVITATIDLGTDQLVWDQYPEQQRMTIIKGVVHRGHIKIEKIKATPLIIGKVEPSYEETAPEVEIEQ